MNYASLLNNPVVVKQLQKKVAAPIVTGSANEEIASSLLADICEDDGLKKPFWWTALLWYLASNNSLVT